MDNFSNGIVNLNQAVFDLGAGNNSFVVGANTGVYQQISYRASGSGQNLFDITLSGYIAAAEQASSWSNVSFIGGAGDDRFILNPDSSSLTLPTLSNVLINGGNGFDQLDLTGLSNYQFDFSLHPENQGSLIFNHDNTQFISFNNIEKIDYRGTLILSSLPLASTNLILDGGNIANVDLSALSHGVVYDEAQDLFYQANDITHAIKIDHFHQVIFTGFNDVILASGIGNHLYDGQGGVNSLSYATLQQGILLDIDTSTTATASHASGTDTANNFKNFTLTNSDDFINLHHDGVLFIPGGNAGGASSEAQFSQINIQALDGNDQFAITNSFIIGGLQLAFSTIKMGVGDDLIFIDDLNELLLNNNNFLAEEGNDIFDLTFNLSSVGFTEHYYHQYTENFFSGGAGNDVFNISKVEPLEIFGDRITQAAFSSQDLDGGAGVDSLNLANSHNNLINLFQYTNHMGELVNFNSYNLPFFESNTFQLIINNMEIIDGAATNDVFFMVKLVPRLQYSRKH